MTNEYLGGQHALRSRHVSVRGGRLTKFKGQVADIAPSLPVVASATVQGINAVRSAGQGHGSLANVTDTLALVQHSAESRRAYVEMGC